MPAGKARKSDRPFDFADASLKEPLSTALFYFAGHGSTETTGGHLLSSDSKSGDEGIALNEAMPISTSED